jgi:GPH family glycoside/pentoside/hexuronide:cation symporter
MGGGRGRVAEVPAPPLRRALCLAYGAGSIGSGVFSTIPGLLLLFYLTDTLAVPAALAGIAMLGPAARGTSSATRSWARGRTARARAGGRRRPFLLAGALTAAGLLHRAVHRPRPATRVLAFAWVLLAFCAAAGAFTLFQVPYATMLTEMTGDYHERTTLVAYRMAFLTVGILAGGALAPGADRGGGRRGRGLRDGWRWCWRW